MDVPNVRLNIHPLTGETGVEVPVDYLLDGLMVAHAKRDADWIRENPGKVRYIGRQGNPERRKYGNPFGVKGTAAEFFVENRQQAVDEYARWLAQPAQAELREIAIAELKGKVLVCHCSPMGETATACHGQVLVRLANPKLDALMVRERQLAPFAKFDHASQFQAWMRDLIKAEKLAAEPVKVLVTGDRNFKASRVVVERMRELGPAAIVIEGEARGADEIARDAARSIGLPVAGFPAHWDPTPRTPRTHIKTRLDGKQYVPSAGVRRNSVMANCEPDRVIAFHDNIERSRGTKDMVVKALRRKLRVDVFTSRGERVPDDVLERLLRQADEADAAYAAEREGVPAGG
jgi:hypothetical protein